MASRLLFSDEHVWVRLSGEHAHLGLSDHLQGRLGEVLSVQLPDVGDEIERGEPLGEIESGREVHELISPLTGTVLAINANLEDQPSLVNDEPYEDGWLIEIEVRDRTELEDLIDADEYEDLISGEDEDEEEEG